jgi:hypothetical protein
MEQWDQDFVDMEVPGYFTFRKDGQGEFQFGLVQGNLDSRIIGERIEFSWAGHDEMDDACGRGWAVIQEGALCGHIFFNSAMIPVLGP